MENNRVLQNSNKNKAIAIILNIIAIGSGHFYINSYKKAILLITSLIVTIYSFYFLSIIYFNKYVFIINIMLVLSIYIYAIYDVLKIINSSNEKIEYQDLINVFFYFICIYLFLSVFVYFAPIKVFMQPTLSMTNTLIVGDRIITSIRNHAPTRGSLIVFNYPKIPEIYYVKRCVATGGDEVLFQDKHLYISFHEGEQWTKENYPQEKLHVIAGKTWVLNPYMEEFQGIHYDENINLFSIMKMYLSQNDLDMQPIVVDELPKNFNTEFNAFYKKVPMGKFYMLGDNRDHSNDSRFWGSVPQEFIFGKPHIIYYSFDNYKLKWNRIGKKI